MDQAIKLGQSKTILALAKSEKKPINMETARVSVPKELIKQLRPTYEGKVSNFNFTSLTRKEQQYVLDWKQARRDKCKEQKRQRWQNIAKAPPKFDEDYVLPDDFDPQKLNRPVTQQEANALFVRAKKELQERLRIEEEEKRNFKAKLKSENNFGDCLACIMRMRGETSIFGGKFSSCKVVMPSTAEIVEQPNQKSANVPKLNVKEN